MIFVKSYWTRNVVFWFFSTIFETFPILWITEQDIVNMHTSSRKVGGRGGTVVKVLCYKSEGRWFDSRWCHNPSDRTMALGSTQPLTEMSTRSISWGKRRPVRKADNLTTILCQCHVIWNPLGHPRPVTRLLFLYIHVKYPSFLSCFHELEFSQQFRKILQYQIW
jgi:hypothetical protein